MLDKKEQNLLFTYFKPRFEFKIQNDVIFVLYYLEYRHSNEDYHYYAIYIEEIHDVVKNDITYGKIYNSLSDYIDDQDFINYIQTDPDFFFAEKFQQIKEKQNAKNLKKIIDSFTRRLKITSQNIINQEQRQLHKNNLMHLEYYLNYKSEYNQLVLSLKVGNNKFYVVKNIAQFLLDIENNEIANYGKQLSFSHQLSNFCEEDRPIIAFLSAYENFAYGKELSVNLLMADWLFNALKGRILYFNNIPYLVRLNSLDLQMSVDKDYKLHTNIKYGSSLLNAKKYLYVFDNDNHIIDYSDAPVETRDFILFSSTYENFDIKPVLNEFRNDFFLHCQDNIKIAPEIQKYFRPNLVTIEAYFDYDENGIRVKTKLKKRENVITVEELHNYFDLKKYQQYVNSLNELGFENDVLKENDAIYRFLTMDFSFLKKICKVYLSENISLKRVNKFNTPSLKVQYQNNLLAIEFSESKYSDEELYQILKAIRKKQKYVILNENTIIDINNEEATSFSELVDDLKLNEKALTKEVEKPLYQSFKLQNYHTNITLDEHVEKIINDLANFKQANFPLPKLNATLRPYQVEGFNWLKILTKYGLGGILADDMGLGKTLEIITLLTSDEALKPSLIVCPKSLIFNWHREFEKFSQDMKIVEIYGSLVERKKIIKQIKQDDKVIYITSYESLRNNDEDFADVEFNYLIIDEGQSIKNINAKKTQSVKLLKAKHRFALTGTPIENNIYDLWSLFDYIMPDYLPPVSAFKDATNDEEFLNKLYKKIAPFILRRTKQEVLTDLPPKYERIITAELTEEQNKVYNAYILKAKEALNSDNKLITFLSIITRLRQICVDPKTFIENYEGTSGKIETLMNIVEEYINNNHRILIFSQFVSALEIIEQNLINKDITYYKLTGETKAKDRLELTESFNNDDDIKVFLISLKAGGTGLNLIGADTIIHLDPWWNVAAENQATDRSHRIGQTKNVEVIKLICRNTIEQRVIELQNLKKDLIDKLISNDDSSITKLSKDDLNFILG